MCCRVKPSVSGWSTLGLVWYWTHSSRQWQSSADKTTLTKCVDKYTTLHAPKVCSSPHETPCWYSSRVEVEFHFDRHLHSLSPIYTYITTRLRRVARPSLYTSCCKSTTENKTQNQKTSVCTMYLIFPVLAYCTSAVSLTLDLFNPPRLSAFLGHFLSSLCGKLCGARTSCCILEVVAQEGPLNIHRGVEATLGRLSLPNNEYLH
jgi:hypothetical protein